MHIRRAGYVFLLLFLFLSFHSVLVSAAQSDASRFNITKRYLYVQPGQTVGGIVKALYPDDEASWPDIAKRLIIANPHAFENGNVNKMISGSRIEIPRLETYAATDKLVRLEVVGNVTQKRGTTFAIDGHKKRRDLNKNSSVYVGDRLFTGADGFMNIKMIDDARIDLRCNSEMLIEHYKMVQDGNTSVIRLFKGSLHKVTGKIGKNITDRYELRTPVATVGVRGTEYSLRVLQSHGCDGSIDVNTDGMFVKVEKGEIDLSNGAGDTSLQPGTAMLVASNKTGPIAVKVKEGVFEALKPKPVETPTLPVESISPEPVMPPPEPEDKGTSWWWILLGVLVLAAA
ncbi:MAG: FecR domain-containing protein [Gammaproteobacteria bacterium]|nr:FecR domain-containing protein [Gammaproteobacteria bacterium]